MKKIINKWRQEAMELYESQPIRSATLMECASCLENRVEDEKPDLSVPLIKPQYLTEGYYEKYI